MDTQTDDQTTIDEQDVTHDQAPDQTDDQTDEQATDNTPGTDQGDDQADGNAKFIAEARKYRKRAQEAEKAHADLEEKYTQFLRDVVDEEARKNNLSGEALWRTGHDPHALVTDSGELDKRAVMQAINAAKTTLGVSTAESPNQGIGSGAAQSSQDWSDIFRR